MSEFNYLKEKARMLKSVGNGEICCYVKCSNCPLSIGNPYTVNCHVFEVEYSNEAEAIVRKWAEEHPRKTRKEVLLEKFPNAKSNKDGVFYVCAYYLGVASKEYYDNCKGDCKRCWNEEVEE